MNNIFNRRTFLKSVSLGTGAMTLRIGDLDSNSISGEHPDALCNVTRKQTPLFKKIYGALIGSAIGDAMGGPVEFWDYRKIKKVYGKVDSLMPYDFEPGVHGPWAKKAGSYTDDTRMSKIFCTAILNKKGVPTDKDLAKTIIDYYHSAEEGLPKQFIEEYYLKAIYRDQKCVFGGQPTNGAIMGIAPFGVINACDPQKALADVFSTLFTTEGYARYATAIAAAMIASAMKPDATVDSIVNDGLDAVKFHKSQVEGHRWQTNQLYDGVGLKNEKLIKQSVALAKKHGDPYSMREELLKSILQQFGADASETLAIAIAMFYAAQGDYVETVKGAVNCGRDNDSSASVAGAIAGAFCGLDKIPPAWIKLVEAVNPTPTFRQIAKSMEDIIITRYGQQRECLNQLQLLL